LVPGSTFLILTDHMETPMVTNLSG